MALYRFDTGGIPTCGKQAGAFYRIEMQTQSIVNAEWSGGLTKPDFAAAATALESPFTFSDLEISGPPDAGSQSVADISFEAHNHLLATAAGAYTGTRFSDIINAVDKETTEWHVRIGWKATSGGTFVWKFWGIVQWDSLEIVYGDFDNVETWRYKFSAIDSVMQLQSRSFAQFGEDLLTHVAYDHVPNVAPQVSYSYASPGTGKSSGAYACTYVAQHYKKPNGEDSWKLIEGTAMRFMRLKEVIQAFSDYLGLGTSVNGTTAGQYHSLKYGYNSHAPTGVTWNWTTFDNLYILSGLWNGSEYMSYGTFFDYLNDTAHSWYKYSDAFEVLKKICMSVGMTCRITVNASNERELTVLPITSAINSVSIASTSICTDARVEPYMRGVSGVQVTVPAGSNVIRGGNGQRTVNVDCIFSVANASREASWNEGWPNFDYFPMRYGELTALWVSEATPTGSRSSTPGTGLTISNMYSVCAIAMYDGTTPVDGSVAMVGNDEPSTNYGEADGTTHYGLGTVVYPKYDETHTAWTEVPAMALAHLIYSDRLGDNDISLYRSKGQQMTLKVKGISAVTYYPGDLITVTINSVSSVWTVQSYGEQPKDDTKTFTLELYA